MSQTPPQKPAPVSSADMLPPVEPPSAGYIIKLFVIPLLIVGVVVMLVMTFNWLSSGEADRGRFIQKLQSAQPDTWQVAHDLATELQRSQELRADAKFAEQLAAVARERIQKPPPDGDGKEAQGEVDLRVFLLRALGQFEVDAPLPVLQYAASQERNTNEGDVRLAAIEAMATLTHNVRTAGRSIDDEKVAAFLVETGQSPNPAAARSRAAYALGVLGGDVAEQHLQKMLDDGYPDARFNAATGLARHGYDKPECLAVLVEMLDPAQTAGLEVEKETQSRDFKRAAIHTNALRAVELLLQKNSTADMAAIGQAVEKLRQSPDLPGPVSLKAQEVLNQLRNRKAS